MTEVYKYFTDLFRSVCRSQIVPVKLDTRQW